MGKMYGNPFEKIPTVNVYSYKLLKGNYRLIPSYISGINSLYSVIWNLLRARSMSPCDSSCGGELHKSLITANM